MTQTYKVEIRYDGNTYNLEVPEDKTVLAAATEAGYELPQSCLAGVCTTCGGKVLSGEVEQGEGMGVSPELQAEGYALLCVSYPRADLVVEAGKEDEIYDRQFGQPS